MSSKGIVDLRRVKSVQRRLFEPLRATGGSREPKRAPLRARRRRWRYVLLVGIIVLLALFAVLARLILYMPQYRIGTIEVSGAQELSAPEIEEHVRGALADAGFRLYPRDSIFFYDKQALQESLTQQFRIIRDVSVARTGTLSQTLGVRITEREPFAYWCEYTTGVDGVSACWVMDAGGFIYANEKDVSTLSESAYRFSGDLESAEALGQTFVDGRMAWIADLFTELMSAGYSPRGGSVEGSDFFVALAEGFVVKVTFKSEPESLTQSLRLVLGSDALAGRLSELEYVDLRFGNRIYYKLKAQVETGEAVQ